MKVDVVAGLAFGDCSKKKVCNWLLKNKNYDFSCRFSGGPNCGGTFYFNDKKYILHHLPTGVFYGVKSIIGSGCVINPKTFLQEIEQIEKDGISISNNIFISENAHIITDKHVEEDIKKDKIGSTGRGIFPVYRDKYARAGKQAKDCEELKGFVCKQHELLLKKENNILLEGNQGIWLDIDHSPFYPYCTSSPATVAYAFHSMGLPIHSVNDIYGCCKAYDTYVGNREFQPIKDAVLQKIQKSGNEFGATTGRARQCNWINLDNLVRAVEINGVNKVIVSKMDVLREVGVWSVILGEYTIHLENEDHFKKFITEQLKYKTTSFKEIIWSDNPYMV